MSRQPEMTTHEARMVTLLEVAEAALSKCDLAASQSFVARRFRMKVHDLVLEVRRLHIDSYDVRTLRAKVVK